MNRSKRVLLSTANNMLRNKNQSVSVKAPSKLLSKQDFKKQALFSTSIKPWKQPFVDCGADYREQEHLEDWIGGPLYAKQKTGLMRLPVPTVEETIKRLVPTALPLAKSTQEAENFQKACQEFVQPNSVSHKLQQLLQQRKDENPNSSWLSLWWNDLAYLTYRDPVTIFVSYFFHFADDSTLPANSAPNVCRAASVIYSMAEYRELICSGARQPDHIGKGDKKTYLCSTPYKYMFHACRIPQPDKDQVRIYDPANHNHVLVARKGYFFTLDFLDNDGQVLPLQVLEDRIQQIINLADEYETKSNVPKYDLGYLTAWNRDDWTNARDLLLRKGGIPMKDALEKLQSSAMTINLDDENPVSRKECAEIWLFGGRHGNGKNRWFDKSITVNITNNGKAAFLGEHAMMDGMPCVTLADHLTNNHYQLCQEKSQGQQTSSKKHYEGGGVTHVFQDAFKEIGFNNPEVSAVIEKAKTAYQKHIDAHEMDVQSFHGYGSNEIKKFGYSPDAFVQIAMQLATYRLWGEQGGTYESTQVRPFLHGRTEVTRTVSEASSKFVKALGMKPKYEEYNDMEQNAKKLQLLQDAVTSHVTYMKNAAQGYGVDRHLLGLSMFCKDDDPTLQTPELFKDPVFIRSKRWRVSTSHLTHPKFDNWGYGEVVPDGVGLSYSIHPRHCVFNITALKEHGWTDKLSQLLEEAMIEMRTLVEMGGGAGDNKNKKSKL